MLLYYSNCCFLTVTKYTQHWRLRGTSVMHIRHNFSATEQGINTEKKGFFIKKNWCGKKKIYAIWA